MKTRYPFFGLTHKGYNNLTTSLGSAGAKKYKYNGKELQDELNLGAYDFGARFYYPDVPFFWRDPMADERAWVSPYNFVQGNPISRVDPDGMLDGDYYGRDGRYLGTDGKDDNKVYVADNVTKNDKGIVTNATNSQELSINHSEYQVISNIIKQESGSTDREEFLWLAHTANNEAKRRGSNMYDLLNTGYSSVGDKTELSTSDNSLRARYARAAVNNVLLGNPDPTGGATQWDGIDFIMKGTNHPKFRQYTSIFIPLNTLFSHISKVVSSKFYHNGFIRYNGRDYSTPSIDFFKPYNLFSFGFYKENAVDYRLPKLEATGAKGLSIFWKKTF
ncbi:hypothetical protein LA303_08885 [Candidatus Sulfidibacterium hydrothermale]|uniref:RHS repeat-associated core domain-containing protein n=1 Tax=Candidatus Sulfidibacterium hydrothermale TaxID=2875962 RepID=UPI001F0B3956|nr:RHS repeat-associated core domain-containing protein [Candidatus Sulfidibacterium hydrothermale]UBM61530.1 hypothetical protein LA303_08885 [Candidatus Sulfidibacterium hydrothermale]